MGNPGPILIGMSGVVQGESYALNYGKSLVIGRSRTCDISIRNCKRWMDSEAAGQLPPESSKTVSRKHFKISYYNASSIEVEDLSSNGTFVDGKRIDRVVITDLKTRSHEIKMGAGETFQLEWR